MFAISHIAIDRVGVLIGGILILAWGIGCVRRRSFTWRASPRDEKTEAQEPTIFWFSAFLWLLLVVAAFGAALGFIPMRSRQSARLEGPNQALQPTRMLVTFCAYAQPAPSTRVADL